MENKAFLEFQMMEEDADDDVPDIPEGFEEAEAKKNEGNAAYKKRDFAKAIELYNEAIELCP